MNLSPRAAWSLLCAAVVWLACASVPVSLFAEEALRLRVLSYNIHHGEGIDGRLDLERIARIIQQSEADVVALQEVDQTTTRTGKVDQPAELARLTGLHVVFGGNIQFQGGHYGNAVLSRHAIVRHENHKLPRHNNGEQRGLLEVEIELPGKTPLLFLATHLDHRGDDSERIASVELINKRVAERPAQLALLAGDLNDGPKSNTLKKLAGSWTSASSEPIPTFPANKPTGQIDFILFRPAERWRVVETRVLPEDKASDHRPILTVLERVPEKAK